MTLELSFTREKRNRRREEREKRERREREERAPRATEWRFAREPRWELS